MKIAGNLQKAMLNANVVRLLGILKNLNLFD
jgi:hypothetical protein